jgi:DNA-binding YbaB/EbfC family protein
MFGGLGNLAGMLKQAKALQENMQKIQEELAAQRFEGDAGAGMVRAEVNGKMELLRVKIDPAAVRDLELLEDLVVAAVSAATAKAQDAAKEKMMGLTGGLNIPGLTDLLGAGGA